MKKYHLKECNFNVTNVCNFNCKYCNRFNNFAFSGIQEWAQLKEIYKKWSEVLSVDLWHIMGGEPTSNKDFLDWVQGIHELWPESNGKILTNGTLLKADDYKFYEILKKANGKIYIEINLHNNTRYHDALSFTLQFLINPKLEEFNENFIDAYNNIKAESWPECVHYTEWEKFPEEIQKECDEIFNFSVKKLQQTIIHDRITRGDHVTFVDDNNIKIVMMCANDFYEHALVTNYETKKITVHNSDPEVAHSACVKRRGDSPEFIDGKLYKCSVSKLLADFDKQFYLDISDQDREILNSYMPADINGDKSNLDQWFDHRHNVIPNCKFCTEDYTLHKITAEKKKIFFPKKEKFKDDAI